MKKFVLLIDGMADMPLAELDNKTPLEAAYKPVMDSLAKKSELGMVKVTPEGCKGGSDVGNLCVMGYDPRKYLTGRSPIEAAAIGIKMEENDLALRCNFVTLSNEKNYEDKIMVDYSAGEITTEEADELIKTLNENFSSDFIHFFTGVSYRHCLILHNAKDNMSFTPPHEFTGKGVKDKLPEGDYSDVLSEMMKKSYDILKNHPVNIKRREKGLNEANSIWLWGKGRRISLPSFIEKHGCTGAVVTAVDLIKGIACCAGMKVYNVEGATGNLKTNFKGKAQAAIKAFKDGIDLVYLHLEAPDECGHQGDIQGKKLSCEIIDRDVLKPVYEYLQSTGEPYSILITPDHPTPLATRAHSSADVPYLIYRSTKEQENKLYYCEKTCVKTGNYIANGYDIIDRM